VHKHLPDLRSFKLTQLLAYKNFKSKSGREGSTGNGFEMLAMGRLWRKNTVGGQHIGGGGGSADADPFFCINMYLTKDVAGRAFL